MKNILTKIKYPFIIITVLFFGVIAGYWYKGLEKTKITPVKEIIQKDVSNSNYWWENILNLEGNKLRKWVGSNKEGYDVCGYSEKELKKIANLEFFEEVENNSMVDWENAEWSPKCSYLIFSILPVDRSLSKYGGTEWIYNVSLNKLNETKEYFYSFVNDNFYLTDGYKSQGKGGYVWDTYKLFDIKNNKIVADIRPPNKKFRNPNFSWIFEYGPRWEATQEKNKISLKVIESWPVFTDSNNSTTNLHIEIYATEPFFDKSMYSEQTDKIYDFENYKDGKIINEFSVYSTKEEIIYPTDKFISCDRWFITKDSEKAPAAIHITNQASEKDCDYDITTKIYNHWISTNQFAFEKF